MRLLCKKSDNRQYDPHRNLISTSSSQSGIIWRNSSRTVETSYHYFSSKIMNEWMNEWMNESYNGKIEFLAAFTPVFSVTWSLISAQETFLIIINFENYFCCLIFLCKFRYTTIWVLPVWELILLFSKDTLKISVLYNCLLVPNFWRYYTYIFIYESSLTLTSV